MFAIPSLARMLAAGLAALALLPQASAEPLPARNGFPSQPIRFICPSRRAAAMTPARAG